MFQKPNFFIVGTPKAGTTSLYNYLEEHPDIYMSPVKETNFFSFNEIKEQGLFYNEEFIDTEEKYARQFKNVSKEIAIGEASVSYLFYPQVALKIKEYQPNAKIIIVLRNPVDRGFSHYLMDKRLGFVQMSFEDIVQKNKGNSKHKLYYQQYVELGFYYNQLSNYYKHFDEKMVKVFLYEDIVYNLQNVIKNVYSFLSVDPDFRPNIEKRHNTFENPKSALVAKLYTIKSFRKLIKFFLNQKLQEKTKHVFFSKNKKPGLSPDIRSELIRLYTNDINKTQDLINRDLSKWLV